MGKRIIISEEQAAMLDLDAPRLPLRLRKALSCGRTSLGDNPAFPPDGDNRFDAEVASEMFKEALDGYNALDMPSKSLEPGDLERTLDKWTARCRELERPLRPRLEDICGNAVSAALAGWGNLVELKAGLVDEVDLPPARLTPEKSSFEDLDGMERVEELNGEVYKRRFLDALVAGAASFYASDAGNYLKEIYALNPELLSLYKAITAINRLLLFLAPEKKPDDGGKGRGGAVRVTLGNADKKTLVEAQGLIFPFLLEESIKGMLELVIAHGLPKDGNEAATVMAKADFALAEAWDERLGPGLWRRLMKAAGSEDPKVMTMVLFNTCQLSPKAFNEAVREAMAGTKRGKRMFSDLADGIVRRLDLDDLDARMNDKRKKSAALVTDYMTVEDLR